MAVVNKWINSSVEDDKKAAASKVSGSALKCIALTFETVAADSNTSVLKLGRLPANAVPVKCDINCDVLTSANSWDLGLYETDGVTVADKALFMSAENISGGADIGSEIDGLQDGPDIDELGKTLWELLGSNINTKGSDYVLAFTGNTIGTSAATVSIRFWYLVG